MDEQTVYLSRSDKTMEVFIVHPDASGPHPLVLMYMDMWGMREVLRGLARRLASMGYLCVLPDFYYRGGLVRYAEHDDGRLGKSFAEISPERQAMLQSAMAGLSDQMVIEDTRALFDYLDATGWARPGSVGAIGYCMGGRHVLCVAGAFPERVRAAACLHGAYLVSERPDSPHLLARQAQGEMYFGHAELDKYAPADVVRRVNEALAGESLRAMSVVHRGAQHGYAIPDRDVYDQGAAEYDWEKIRAMLQRQLLN
ncbi:MAG: dienelactone hydrolase family protein [Burkholderiales bacterium]